MTAYVEKYRPKTLSDCVLPDRIKLPLKSFIDKDELPNCLFVGSAGLGKTSTALSIINDMNLDFIKINGSLDRNIDTLRNEIQQFTSTNSLSGNRKCVLIDECDGLNPVSFQPALRSFMEDYAQNVSFILTANYQNKIIEPLKSRCTTFNFGLSKEEKGEVIPAFYAKLKNILKQENIKCDDEVLKEIIKKYMNDWRKLINELQKFSSSGKLESGIFQSETDPSINAIVEIMRKRNFSEMTRWVSDNYQGDFTDFCSKLYRQTLANNVVEKSSIPEMVLLINEYMYKSAFVLNQEINMAAFLTDAMKSLTFKD